MRYSTRLSDAIHIVVFICLDSDVPKTSAKIAESIHTNPSYVRTLMAKLKAGHVITNNQGSARAAIARPTDEITMLDIYRAIEGDKPLLHLDTHVSAECNAGVFIQLAIQDCYDEIQHLAEKRMATITLADIIDLYESKVEDSTERWGSLDSAVAHALAELSGE